MADARRRYLEIQRELGGNEVILSAPLGEIARAAAPHPEPPAAGPPPGPPGADPLAGTPESGPAPARRPAGGGAAAEAPPVDSPQPSSRQDWRKNCPPIPTAPGIVLLAPERGLMDSAPEWESLGDVARAIAGCRKCFLAESRTHTVPGEGNPRAQLMFVGEGPGQTEDETGRPFVGRAGELLTQIIEALGMKREDVFIANAVKCRPPQNRKPLPDEMTACWSYLERQIELIRPKVIVALGATAAEVMLRVRRSLAELRERVHSYRGIPLVVTYHPAALLRNPNWKKPTWDDVRIARQLLDR